MSALGSTEVDQLVHPHPPPSRPVRARRWPVVLAYVVLIGATAGVLAPILWAVYTSLRPISDTLENGYFSLPSGGLTLDNYTTAWERADLGRYFVNTMVIVLPAVFVVLLLSSFIAYAVSRFSFKFNLAVLLLFTAGNLLPQQVVITPLYLMYSKLLWLPFALSEDGYWINSQTGLVMIHIAFQMGFCTFVMSSYMKTIPGELTEAALVDGASVLAPVLLGDPAVVPGPAGSARDPGVHLDLQRLLLGTGADDRQPGRPADHHRAELADRHLLHQRQPGGRGIGPDRAPHHRGVHHLAEAVRRRSDPRRQQGMRSP